MYLFTNHSKIHTSTFLHSLTIKLIEKFIFYLLQPVYWFFIYFWTRIFHRQWFSHSLRKLGCMWMKSQNLSTFKCEIKSFNWWNCVASCDRSKTLIFNFSASKRIQTRQRLAHGSLRITSVAAAQDDDDDMHILMRYAQPSSNICAYTQVCYTLVWTNK